MWWLLPVVVGLASVGGGARLVARGRRIAAAGESSGDRDLAVRGATLVVAGTMMVTWGCAIAAGLAMLSYALR